MKLQGTDLRLALLCSDFSCGNLLHIIYRAALSFFLSIATSIPQFAQAILFALALGKINSHFRKALAILCIDLLYASVFKARENFFRKRTYPERLLPSLPCPSS